MVDEDDILPDDLPSFPVYDASLFYASAGPDPLLVPAAGTMAEFTAVRRGTDGHVPTTTHQTTMVMLAEVASEPKTYAEAMASPHAKEWAAAVKSELD